MLLQTRLKGRHSELDEARTIQHAVNLWWTCQHPIPVIWGRRMLGMIRGFPYHGKALWVPAYELSQGTLYPDYDTCIAKQSAGKVWATHWFKPFSTSNILNNWYDAWGTDGNPQKGDWSGSARTARSFTASTTGAMYHGGAVSPSLKYLTRATQFSGENAIRSLIIYDRVLSYDASTMSASSQNMTNTAPATRYITNGDPGLQIFVEADTVHNATAANLSTLAYTSNAGTAGQLVTTTPTLSKIVSILAPTAAIGARCVIATPGGTITSGNPYLTLAPGDEGVQKIENFQWSAAPTGTCSYVLQFPLALFPDIILAGQSSDYEFINGIEAFNKQIFDDACLSIMYCNAQNAQPAVHHGRMVFGWT